MEFCEIKNLPNTAGIYCIKNLKNEKCYIGSCVSFKKRLTRHRYYLNNGIHHSQKLQRSWDKHGSDSFRILIIEETPLLERADILLIEEKYINQYNSFTNGYNMTDLCLEYKSFKLSEEAIEKRRIQSMMAVIAIDRFTGKFKREYESLTEAAESIGDQTTNISSVCKGTLRYVKDTVFVYKEDYDPEHDYKVIKHHMAGVPKSEETKAKMRANNAMSKSVYKYDEDYNLIQVFKSMAQCERDEGIKKGMVRYKMDKFLDGFLYTREEKIKDIV